MNDQQTLGMAGLGTMGGAIARRLIDHGHRLVVFDPNADAMAALESAGACCAKTLTDLASRCDVIFLSLPTPDVVKEVTLGENGLVRGMRVTTIVDLSTTGREISEIVELGLQAEGKQFIDSPVSGGGSGAVDGTLAIIASGPGEAIDDLKAVFACFGHLFVVGERAGQAQTLKVINNMISVTSLAITSEAMVLGTKAGLDPDAMIDVFNASSGRTTSSVDKIPNCVLSRSFDFGMTVGLSAKDIRLCLEESDRHGVPMMVGSAVRQLLHITRDQFGPDVDMTNLIRVVEQWAHVEVTGRAARNENHES